MSGTGRPGVGGPAATPPATPPATPAATLSGVRLRYGGKVALDGIDLEIPAGRMTAMIGPDGVGKSSLFALVAGARKVQEGHIEVLGGDIADRHHREKVGPRIAYMPQGLGRNLYPTLSVFENLEFFGRLFGQDATEREGRIDDLFPARAGMNRLPTAQFRATTPVPRSRGDEPRWRHGGGPKDPCSPLARG